MSDIKSFTTHNFDAVNDQIQQISKRERARTFAYRLQSLRTIFLYAAGVALNGLHTYTLLLMSMLES